MAPTPAAAAATGRRSRRRACPTGPPSRPPCRLDWPHRAAGPRTRLAATATADTVVVRGDCLWHIASDRLLTQHGRMPTDGEVAAASQAWWQANAEVIGPDPDLLLPGQVLSPPTRHEPARPDPPLVPRPWEPR